MKKVRKRLRTRQQDQALYKISCDGGLMVTLGADEDGAQFQTLLGRKINKATALALINRGDLKPMEDGLFPDGASQTFRPT